MNERILTNKITENFYLFLKNEERSCNTIEKYKRDITAFCRFLSNREVTKELCVEYKKYILDCGYSERSVNSMIAAVNSLFHYLEWYDCKIKSIKIVPDIYRTDEKELSQKEYERLVFTAKAKGKEKTALILQTICATGIRVSELQYITVESLNRNEAKVNCKGKIRKVFIPNNLKKLLVAYIRKHKIKTGAIFLSKSGKPISRTFVWRVMKSLCAAANVKPSKVFPHNLRHLFARIFYKIEKDIAKLADVLGHSNINTTRIYIISTGNEHKKIIEKMMLVCYG